MSDSVKEQLCHETMDNPECIQVSHVGWGLNHSLSETWQNI